jgi:hypothetical protein
MAALRAPNKVECLQWYRLIIPDVNKNNIIGGAGLLGKMTSPGGKLTVLACHPNKKESTAE